MKKGQAWYLHSANFLVGVTGLIYAYFIYCGQPVDEYSNINSPYQPILQQLHILFAPLLVFGCGMIWMNHAWLMYKSPIATRRRTGTILLFSAWPMILSGVIIQIVTEPLALQIWKWVHLGTSVLWLMGYLVHLKQKRHS